MQCPKCGTENPDGAQICNACGYVFEYTEPGKPVLKPKTSRLAIASFLLSICTAMLFFLAAIPAIILGIISIFQISKSGGKLKGKPFAVAGIIISLLLMSGLYLWSLDAPPIPNDYTIADLRSAPPDCAQSYDILLTLADANASAGQANETAANEADELIALLDTVEPNKIHEVLKARIEEARKNEPDAPAIGLSGRDITVIYQVDAVIEEGDYPKITEFLTANANDIMHAWENAKKGRDIINELNEFAEIADLTRPVLEAEADFLPNLTRLSYLYRIYAHLQCEKGNSEDAVRQLIELDSVFRKLSPNARSLVAKLVCFGGVNMRLTTANFIVNNPNTSRESLELLAEHFVPLAEEQLSLRNAFISEYLMFRDTLDTEFRKVGNRSTPTLKRNSSFRVYRNHCNQALEYAQEASTDKGPPYCVWPDIYPGFMPQVSLTGKLTPWECWQYKYYNPIGSIFLSILASPLEGIVDLRTNVKVQDDLFQIVLNKRLGNEVSLKARAYSDEYIIDIEKKKILSPGPDAQPDTDDDIKLPINPQVLGLLSK